VTEIGFNAFNGCSNLKTVKLSANITSLNQGIFTECSSLESVIIPNGVKSIGKFAFEGCSSLGSINLPETLEEIGEQAFFGCSSLKQLFIPKNFVRFGKDENNTYWSFIYGCTSLTSIVVDKDNHVFDSRDNCNAIIETACNTLVAGCITTTIPEGIITIGSWAFGGFKDLTSISLPNSLNRIEQAAFNGSGLREIIIPENVTYIGAYAFSSCNSLKEFYCYAEKVPEAESSAFGNTNLKEVTLHVPAASVSAYQATEPWKNFKEIMALAAQDDYRPFVEEGKVWKAGSTTGISDGIVKMVEYYYFDGDTIIDGRTCKQMMCQRYVSPNHPDYAAMAHIPSLRYVGAWYEEDKKVYIYNAINQLRMMYDFSLGANDTLLIDNKAYVIGPKQTGGLNGFKGVYRNIMWCFDGDAYYTYYNYNTTWLEGVGGIDGPTVNVYYGSEGHGLFLMSCTVGDEVIYLNDKYEDGATPEAAGARKNRFDFSHTIKTKPKAPRRSAEESPLYGEYNDQKLGINLNPLDNAYLVSITDESGKVVYKKAVNAGNIVGLNIDISAYSKGRYTVTVENNDEVFTGQFEAQTTGIEAIIKNKVETRPSIYNLQGQRLGSMQKGLNIFNGQKIFK
jgi:hypothetical protein